MGSPSFSAINWGVVVVLDCVFGGLSGALLVRDLATVVSPGGLLEPSPALFVPPSCILAIHCYFGRIARTIGTNVPEWNNHKRASVFHA